MAASGATIEPAPAPPVRYIKLGRGSAWAERSLLAGEIHFGHRRVPHDLALRGDKEAVIRHLVALGQSAAKAKDLAREVMDFYPLGPGALWFTFHSGHLWRAHADPEVIWLGKSAESARQQHGLRFRRTLGGWRKTDSKGRPIVAAELSTKLTKVAAYRQTLCSIEPENVGYLMRKLAGEPEPQVAAAIGAKGALTAVMEGLVKSLHQTDFETLVDIILARSGWHRTSALGGNLKDVDLILEQVVTKETAFVQVKSEASQKVLEGYIRRFQDAGTFTRLIFACHSPKGALRAGERRDVIIWALPDLAEMVVQNGLVDWLIARAG
jgi:hypothetical protein